MSPRLRTVQSTGTTREMYQSRPPQVLAKIPEGANGVRETLKLMRDWVRAFKVDPTIRSKALELIFYIPRYQVAGKVAAVFNFVKSHVRYVPDPTGVEMVHW